jgi:hypothetical protein
VVSSAGRRKVSTARLTSIQLQLRLSAATIFAKPENRSARARPTAACHRRKSAVMASITTATPTLIAKMHTARSKRCVTRRPSPCRLTADCQVKHAI